MVEPIMTQVTLKTNLSDITYPTLMQKLFSMRYQWWVNSCEYNNCVVNLPKASQGLPTSASKTGLVRTSMDRTARLQVMSQRHRNFDENRFTRIKKVLPRIALVQRNVGISRFFEFQIYSTLRVLSVAEWNIAAKRSKEFKILIAMLEPTIIQIVKLFWRGRS